MWGCEVLTSAEMRAIEAAAMASGQVSGLELMERAGAAVVAEIGRRWPMAGRVCVLCGPGNNGGDGYVIARLLHRAGWSVRVLGMENDAPPDAACNRDLWRGIGEVAPLDARELRREDADLYVDAIFGTGLVRPVADDLAAVLAHLGGRNGDRGVYQPRLVAVDCPSGLCLDSGAVLGLPRGELRDAPRAALTVAFDSPKPGHLLESGPALCGDLVIADIGLRRWREDAGARGGRSGFAQPVRCAAIAPDFGVEDGRSELTLADPRRFMSKGPHWHAQAHKFSYGHALVLAGGPGQSGAARLAARAALRVGAGLVTIAPPESAMAEHAGPPDALMRRAISEVGALAELLADPRLSALCLGPGCGIARAEALLDGVLSADRATVLDADALSALARRGRFDGLHARCVLTPHAGEFARLFPDLAARLSGPKQPTQPEMQGLDLDALNQRQSEIEAHHAALAAMTGPAFSKLDATREAAARASCVVLFKGIDTVIAAPDGRAVIHCAAYGADAPWLATAGSGDVLAGLIAGIMARGMAGLEAASLAAWLHARAGRHVGPGLIADDLPEAIPAVFAAMGL